MQKIVRASVVLFSLLWMVSSHAQGSFGICSYDKATISAVNCYGPAILKNTVVTGEANVAGPFKAFQSSLSSINIKGVVELHDTTIKNKALVMGVLSAENSHFQQGLSIATETVELTGSTIIGAVNINSTDKAPVLELFCHSTISGPVTFGEQPGLVRMSSDSIIHGKIMNGSIEIIKKSC